MIAKFKKKWNTKIIEIIKYEKKLYPYRNAFGKSEINYLKKVVNYYKSKKIDPPYQGHFEKKLSGEFSKYMHGGYSLPVSSGTSAALLQYNLLC